MQHFGVCKKRAFGIPMPLPVLLNDKYRQAVRIMKITAFILLVCTLHVSAGSFSQSITLSEKEAPLTKVFKAIEKQTDYIFFYNTEWVKKAERVNVEVKNMQLQQVLELLFKNQPITYSITGKMITVIPKKNEIPLTSDDVTVPALLNLHGKVVDENGKPVPGVTVTIKGTNRQTLTDENGEFVFSGVEGSAVLTFSSVNMEAFEINVSGKSEVLAKLKTKTSELDEVQIIGYGQTTKRFQTGNVSTIKAVDIDRQPIKNPLLALQGRVPGLFITQNSGLPNGGVTVRIQGQNSIRNGNDPLYIVDGVPYSAQLLPTIVSVLGSSGNTSPTPAGSGNPFNFINASDIESIDVLKDADATAIYGSRAANGAILITTKKGVAGKTKLTANMQSGIGHVGHFLDLLNTSQYLEMRREAIKNDGLDLNSPPFNFPIFQAWLFPDINGYWDSTRNTDWQEKLIGGNAKYNDVQISASGGSGNTNFIVGGGYHNQTTVFPGDLSDQKVSIHFVLNNVSSNRRFGVQFSGNYLNDYNKLSSYDLTSVALQLPPDAPLLTQPDGSLNWQTVPNGGSVISTWTNPLAALYQFYKNKTDNLVANSTFNYLITQGLDLKCSLGYTKLSTNETSVIPKIAQKPEDRPLFPGASLYGTSSVNSWIIEPQITYSRIIGKGKLETLIGETFQRNTSNGEQLIGIGYNSDLVLEDKKSAASIYVNSTQNSVYKYNAIFGRLNYNWEQKYILNLTARRDGSSRFGAKSKFHNFGSIAGSWIFSKGKLFTDNLTFLSFGKLKASYGTTGSDQIGDYQFMNLYSPIGVLTAYQGTTGLQPLGIPNPYLQWEETKKLQFGLDLGFFNDKLLLNLTYFRNRSSNQLLPYSLPYTTGVSAISALNFPALIQNSGWEISVSTENLKTSKFSWNSNFNITIPNNKLIDFPDLANSSYANDLIIGQPFTLLKVFHFVGVDPLTGLYQVLDKDEKATSSPDFSTDRTVLLNTSPKYYGGFQNTFTYKGFELDFFFQFVKQIGTNYVFGNTPGQFSNQPSFVMQRWQKSGDASTIQKFTSAFGPDYPAISTAATAAQFSDRGFSDASYIRLKNVSFSWQLPQGWRRKIHLDNCKAYFHAQNLLTLTNYRGLDPETMSNSTLPPLRILTFGLQLGL